MEKLLKNKSGRLVLLCVGLFINGIAGFLYVNSNFGADPMNVLGQGIAGLLHIQAGTANSLIQAALFIVALFCGRKYLGASSVLGIFIIGGVINLLTGAIGPQVQEASVLVRLILNCLVGPWCAGFGVALIQTSNLGMTPNDIPAVVLSDHIHKISYKTLRILYDLTQFVIGVVLGGIFGIGTLAAALLTGPFIHISLKLLKQQK